MLFHCETYTNNFNTQDWRGLVSVQFFAVLNMILAVDSELSKNSMAEFFSNFSIQALSRSNNSVLLNFEVIKKLAINIKNLFRDKFIILIPK